MAELTWLVEHVKRRAPIRRNRKSIRLMKMSLRNQLEIESERFDFDFSKNKIQNPDQTCDFVLNERDAVGDWKKLPMKIKMMMMMMMVWKKNKVKIKAVIEKKWIECSRPEIGWKWITYRLKQVETKVLCPALVSDCGRSENDVAAKCVGTHGESDCQSVETELKMAISRMLAIVWTKVTVSSMTMMMMMWITLIWLVNKPTYAGQGERTWQKWVGAKCSNYEKRTNCGRIKQEAKEMKI